MPVSEPSYFPPNRANGSVVGITAGTTTTGSRVFLAGLGAGSYTTISDIIVIGDSAFSAGIQSVPQGNAYFRGTTIVGSQSLKSLITAGASAANQAPFTAVGYNIAPNLVVGGGNVMVGDNIATAAVGEFNGGVWRNVMIGTSVLNRGLANASVLQIDNVLIGYGAAQCDGSVGASFNSCVVIGSFAADNIGSASNCVVIGYNSGQSLGHGVGGVCNFNTIVGAQSCAQLNSGTNNTCIGSQIAGTMTSSVSNVLIGDSVGNGAGGNIPAKNVVVGQAGQIVGAPGTNDCNVFLGYQVNALRNSYASKLLIEIKDDQSSGGAQKALVFGDFASGSVVLGNSTEGTNRDVPGSATNIVKLLNGTIGVANPIGGGYLYVSAGVLHWVDSGGVDTTLSLGAAGQLASSKTSYTNNAGAQAATLTNSPTAGNPTKWIPINDNGTIRNVPAW